MKIAPPFGIDLGTTRTAAAVFLPGTSEPSVAVDGDGRHTLPSVVRAADKERWLVGDDALEDSSEAPLLESVKRFMGSNEAIPDDDELLPEEASAIIVSAIAARMREHVTGLYPDRSLRPRDAVITVPAYFDAPQIEATRRAGELAGLRVAGLVQEPTAAAIYHTWKNDIGDGTFLVYDLGGGTFDVSVIRTIFGEYQVLAIDGDNHLGGDDFDRRLAEYFRADLEESGFEMAESLESEKDRLAFQTLRRIARQTKVALSDADSVDVDEEALFADRSGRTVDLKMTVTRDKFEEVIEDLLQATILSCHRALQSAHARHGLEPTEVDGIFLVGGSTRVPAVPRRLLATIGEEIGVGEDDVLSDEPETSVARGAALHAAAVAPLKFEDDDAEVTIAVTDLPSDNPDRRLIGHVDYGGEPTPTEISFGDDQMRTSLEEPGDPPRFSIDDIIAAELEPEDETLVATALYRDEELLYGPVDLWLPDRPENARPAPTLALTNPAVLAKDINVEVVEEGKSARHTLIERGTHLPTTARHRLVTGDRSGSLVLRLFQHRLPIHTLVLPLPETTPPGTPVELTVDVDQAMNLTASGSVDDQTFWARIDRPSAPRRRQWEEIEELMDRTDQIAERLWGMEARRFAEEQQNLFVGIRAAVRHDRHRLQVLARRLEALAEEYAPRPQRTPGRSRIDTLLDTIRRLVFAAEDERLGRSRDEWASELRELTAQVDQAWRGDDDSRWRDLADRIQAIYESVAQDEFMFRRRDPERYARTLFETTQAQLQALHRAIQEFPRAADSEARELQRAELERIEASVDELRRRLPDAPPAPAELTDIERLARSIGHLERRLERVHIVGVPRRGESP